MARAQRIRRTPEAVGSRVWNLLEYIHDYLACYSGDLAPTVAELAENLGTQPGWVVRAVESDPCLAFEKTGRLAGGGMYERPRHLWLVHLISEGDGDVGQGGEGKAGD